MHAAFAAFWRGVRDQRTLLALDESRLAATIAQAVVAGRAAVDAQRWDALPPVVAAVESGHVERLMRQWIDTVERHRPPFAVADAERRVDLTLAGHALALRIDHVEALTGHHRIYDAFEVIDAVIGAYASTVELRDGTVLVVYYEEGSRSAVRARWFGLRPDGIEFLAWEGRLRVF